MSLTSGGPFWANKCWQNGGGDGEMGKESRISYWDSILWKDLGQIPGKDVFSSPPLLAAEQAVSDLQDHILLAFLFCPFLWKAARAIFLKENPKLHCLLVRIWCGSLHVWDQILTLQLSGNFCYQLIPLVYWFFFISWYLWSFYWDQVFVIYFSFIH